MRTFELARLHSLAPWTAASVMVAIADVWLPQAVAICCLQVVLQLGSFRWLAAYRAVTLSSILVVATVLPGLIRWLPVFDHLQIADGVMDFHFSPIRLWVAAAIGAGLVFHSDLQKVRKRRLRLRQQLQRKVRRRSLQIRRINDALRREVARRQATQERLTRTETHLQSLAQRMQLQVLRKDIDGVITYANEAFCKNIGRAVDDVIGRTDADLYPKKIADKYRSDDASVMSSGIPVDHVESHPTSVGKTSWVQVFKAAEYDLNNVCTGIQMVFWDVTDTYWQTAELRRSEARKRAIFDAAREAVLLVDDSGRIVEANQAAELLIGKGTASLAGLLIESVAVPDAPLASESESGDGLLSADEASATSSLTLPSGTREWTKRRAIRWQEIPTSERREMTVRLYDGTVFPAEISVHPIPLENSQGLAVFVRDVTLRHEAIRALRDAKRVAEEANRTKSEFMAGVSHEIRTPLGGITGSADLLSRMELPDRAKQYVNMIRQSGDMLSGVIGDILDFASIEAGRLQIDPEPTDLHQCIGEAFRCLASRATGKDVELILDIAPDVPRHVLIDPKRIRQIVNNLAGNAIKFTPKGYVWLRVRKEIHLQDLTTPNIVIEVIDTGIGVAQELQAKIFEPFEQGDSGTTRRYGGTGLGLSISNQLVRQMGGMITVESRSGSGSTFRCVIPMPMQYGPAKQSEPALSPTIADGEDRGGVAVALMNPVQRRVVTELLRNNGFRIERSATTRITDTRHGPAFPVQDTNAKTIRLARVDESLTNIDESKEVVLFKPVLPDELIRVVTMLVNDADEALFASRLGLPSVAPESSVGPGPALGDIRVLVVDDSEVNRTVIRDFLHIAGFHADVVDCGAAAVIATQSQTYHCILMDLQMPEMDGVETMQMIHKRCHINGTTPPPIIALTAHATAEHQERCLREGMKSFLVKPIEPTRLIETVTHFTLGGLASTPPDAGADSHKTSDTMTWQQKLLQNAGGDHSTMQTLAEAFVVEVPQLCDGLEASIATGNLKEARRMSHTLKSCLRYVASPADWQPFLDIENAASKGDSTTVRHLAPSAIIVARYWAKRVAQSEESSEAKTLGNV